MKISVKKLISSQELRNKIHKEEVEQIKFLLTSVFVSVACLLFLGLEVFTIFGLSTFIILLGFLLIFVPFMAIYKIINPPTKYQFSLHLLFFIFILEVALISTGYGNLIIGSLIAVIALLFGYIFYNRIIINLEIKSLREVTERESE